MSSFSGNDPQRPPSSSSLNSYQFDFDLGLSGRGGGASSSSRPLRDQKPNPKPSSAPSWTPHQPNKPSWTHQPAPAPRSSLANTPSWTPAAPSSLGIPDKNPNLFSDLVGSALGQSKSSSNVPLKSSASRNSYSMGSLSDSLPKSTTTAAPTTNNFIKSSSKSADNLNNFPSVNQPGATPMKSSSSAAPMNTKKDPFETLAGFGSKPSVNPPNSGSSGGGGYNFSFGAFQNPKVDSFPKPPAVAFPATPAFQKLNMDGFGMPSTQSFTSPPPQPQPQPVQDKSEADPLYTLFASSASSAGVAPATAGIPEVNDWDLGSEFGGNDGSGGGTTTELEGLPPPPSGVTASAAKSKGLDNYKQGQFADAIKWLTWAVVLFDKSGDSGATGEVLSCRASCYKEVGEYKKAVSDCSKVLDHDNTNVAVLLQRALLYESTEKYRLGTEDLRMVLKIDPGNRLARSTIHRLSKLAD